MSLITLVDLNFTPAKDTESVIILKCEMKLHKERMINPHKHLFLAFYILSFVFTHNVSLLKYFNCTSNINHIIYTVLREKPPYILTCITITIVSLSVCTLTVHQTLTTSYTLC